MCRPTFLIWDIVHICVLIGIFQAWLADPITWRKIQVLSLFWQKNSIFAVSNENIWKAVHIELMKEN